MTMPQATTMPPTHPAALTPRAAGNVRAQRKTSNLRTKIAPYLFLTPYFLVTCVFFLYPLAYATVLAFYQTSGPAHRQYVGFDNFRFVLLDPDFRKALANTLIF